MKRTSFLMIALSFLIITSESQAADIDGSFRVPKEFKETNAKKPLAFWRVWNGYLSPKTTSEIHKKFSVVLTGSTASTPIGCHYAIKNAELKPQILVAKTAAPFLLRNTDGTSHQINIINLDGFVSTELSSNGQKEIKLPQGGPWKIEDKFYSHIQGFVHSLPDLNACASMSVRKNIISFNFKEIPDGEYTLHVFYLDKEVASKKITIENSKNLSNLKIKIKK